MTWTGTASATDQGARAGSQKRSRRNYKAASLFEARPYCAGVQDDGYDHMKEVADKEYRKFDFATWITKWRLEFPPAPSARWSLH